MVAVLTADAPPEIADTAGQPGYCCLCGRAARFHLCHPCRLANEDPLTGHLPPWLATQRREAQRLWKRRYDGRDHPGVLSYDRSPCLLVYATPVVGEGSDDRPRRLHRKGARTPPPAPQVDAWLVAGPTEGLWHGDPVVMLRRYSPSGVPLDMVQFLALLDRLFGWPPPGMVVDRRHGEALVNLYERVYEA